MAAVENATDDETIDAFPSEVEDNTNPKTATVRVSTVSHNQ